ncbi:MAG: CoA transferase [Candidatus Rokubacteria bacterium]|nr:CoA transferase [Candidatus Rokubacteria bacterium]
MREAPRLLEGLRMLDLSAELRGAYCGRLLAEYGAEVILVEAPDGNPWRHVGPFAGDDPHPEKSVAFLHYYAGRRSVAIDLADARGRDLLLALTATADVLLEDMLPARRKALGLSAAMLAVANPRLILASLTPFGQTGPERDSAGGDLVATAAGGLAALTGDPARAPLRPGGDQGEHITALHGAVAVLGAVLARDAGGAPARVDVSAQECVASVLENAMEFALLEGRTVARQNGRHPISWPGRVFPCADGHVVISCGSAPQARACFALVDDHAMAADPVLEDRDVRRANADGLEARLIERFRDREKDDLFHRGQALGIPIGVVHDAETLLRDPQLLAYGFFRDVEHPDAGVFTDVGAPFRVDGAAPPLGRAPRLGEHTAEILEAIGVDAGARAALEDEGVIR